MTEKNVIPMYEYYRATVILLKTRSYSSISSSVRL